MPFSFGLENLQPAFDDSPIPYIAHGARFHNAAAEHVEHTLNASRAYLIVDETLSNSTPQALSRLKDALGSKLIATHIFSSPQTPWESVLTIAKDAASHNPDTIITLGGGNLTDAAKIIAWMLANEITTSEGMDQMWHGSSTQRSDLKPSTIRTIAIPTTLSPSDYQPAAIITRSNDKDNTTSQHTFNPPARNPALIILDPDLTTTTPPKTWYASGISGLSYCIETMISENSTDETDERVRSGLLKLLPALLRTKADPHDLDARFDAQMGLVDSMAGVAAGLQLGGSCVVAKQLGSFGVSDGDASCVVLPAVVKWNADAAVGAKLESCKRTLLRSSAVKGLVGSKIDQVRLDGVLDLCLRELGLPRTLAEVGVERAMFDELAENVVRDPRAQTNPVSINTKEQVLEILESVVG